MNVVVKLCYIKSRFHYVDFAEWSTPSWRLGFKISIIMTNDWLTKAQIIFNICFLRWHGCKFLHIQKLSLNKTHLSSPLVLRKTRIQMNYHLGSPYIHTHELMKIFDKYPHFQKVMMLSVKDLEELIKDKMQIYPLSQKCIKIQWLGRENKIDPSVKMMN